MASATRLSISQILSSPSVVLTHTQTQTRSCVVSLASARHEQKQTALQEGNCIVIA